MNRRIYNAGDAVEFSASQWNSFVEAADYVRQRTALGVGDVGSRATPVIVNVVNATGQAVDRFTAVEIVGASIEPPVSSEQQMASAAGVSWPGGAVSLSRFLTDALPRARTPSSGDVLWGVAVDPIPSRSDLAGRAAVAGVVPCRVSLLATTDTHVVAVSGSRIPVGSNVGTRLVYVSGGVGSAARTGEQWGLVHLGDDRRTAMVKVSANAAGGGKYTGTIVLPKTSDVSESGNLGGGDFGGDGGRVLILNAVEQGANTHDLTAGSVWPAVLVRVNNDGRPVMMTAAVQVSDCPTSA